MKKVDKDYSRWNTPVYKLRSISDILLLGEINNGIYSIGAENCNIDILISGIKKDFLKEKSPCLVFFGGALAGRTSDTKPPFFSGLGIASSTSTPLISISDPTLDFSSTLLLSWYAGNKGACALPVILSAILDHLAELYGLSLILIGGSGGGFAALCQASLLTCETTVVVWNPQTDISEYNYKAVIDYLSTAFPENTAKDLLSEEEPKRHEAIKCALDRSGIYYSLINKEIPKKAKILYLQNIHDWHVLSHAKPFLINEKNKWLRLEKNSFFNSENITLHFGNWGAGHAGPPGEIIGSIVKKIASGDNIANIIDYLAADTRQPQYTQFFLADESKIKNNISVVVTDTPDGCKVLVKPPVTPSDNLEYAIYVFVGGVRNAYWYQNHPEFKITFSKCQIEAVRVFIRDVWQNVKWKEIKIDQT